MPLCLSPLHSPNSNSIYLHNHYSSFFLLPPYILLLQRLYTVPVHYITPWVFSSWFVLNFLHFIGILGLFINLFLNLDYFANSGWILFLILIFLKFDFDIDILVWKNCHKIPIILSKGTSNKYFCLKTPKKSVSDQQ